MSPFGTPRPGKKAAAAAIAVAFILLTWSGSAGAADVAQGGKLAQRWCASCHVVRPDQPRASAEAPSFASISAARKVPEITSFLMQNHPQMPDMNLSRDEIADLIAYMQSLAPPLDPIKKTPEQDNPPKEFRG